MIKRLIISVLCIAILCTLFVGSALATTVQKTVGGVAAACTSNWNTSKNGAYATSSLGVAADYIAVTLKYTYKKNGIVTYDMDADSHDGGYLSAQASVAVTGSNGTAKHSVHVIDYNGDYWAYELD